MVDTHCHLNFQSFESDYAEVIQRAYNMGVTLIINTGTSLQSSKQAIELADKYSHLYAIVGIHPHHADKLEENWQKKLSDLTKHHKVIGIGEIGLDYYAYKSNGIADIKMQRHLFEQQIQLACTTKLPLQIHNRLAGEDVVSILQHYSHDLMPIPGMFHCFAGTKEIAKTVLEMGFYIGFDGNSTYSGLAPGETVPLPELIRYVPLDRIVCETDSPYLTPQPFRGQRNEPQYVILVAETVSRIKNVSYDTVVDQTTKNVYSIFPKL